MRINNIQNGLVIGLFIGNVAGQLLLGNTWIHALMVALVACGLAAIIFAIISLFTEW